MSTKLVNYKLPNDLISKIETMSTGNKTALVIDLLEQAIAMRSVKDQTRWYMYEGAKRAPDFNDDHVALRNVLDGLHI
tara:strand:+ start:979 stop:1212 length:234 start_codon:yes stop_codon:yes gene_type:complete